LFTEKAAFASRFFISFFETNEELVFTNNFI